MIPTLAGLLAAVCLVAVVIALVPGTALLEMPRLERRGGARSPRLLHLRTLLDRGASRRARAMREQLPEFATSVAAGMRAGLSLPQAVAFAADEAPEPMASSLRGLLDQAAMGTPFGDALTDWSRGLGQEPECRLLTTVLALHRRTGGELSSVLGRVVEALADRRAAAREARSLTAQARLSGAILGLLPVGFLAFLTLLSPGEMLETAGTPAGVACLVLGLTLEGFAFLWIRSLLRVEA